MLDLRLRAIQRDYTLREGSRDKKVLPSIKKR